MAVVFAVSASAARHTGAHATGARASNLRIALIIPDFTQNELILDLKDGSQAAAKQLGAQLLITGTGSAEDQAKAVQDAIAAHVNAIVYDTTDAAALSPAIKKANAANIPVICNNSCSSSGKNAVTVTFNYKTMGQLTGKWIASQLKGGTGTVGIIDTNRTDSSVADIYTGIHQGLAAAHAHPKIVISPPTNWDPATAQTVAQNFLTANPNLNVLVCLHDLVAAVCRQVMNSTNYPKIPLAGEGGTCQGLSNLLNGNQDFTVAEFLYKAGVLGIQDAVQVVNGHTPKNTLQIAPMIGISAASAKAMASGSAKVPPGLGLETALKNAKAGCK
jgi:ribose transport system substrate-binding protein